MCLIGEGIDPWASEVRRLRKCPLFNRETRGQIWVASLYVPRIGAKYQRPLGSAGWVPPGRHLKTLDNTDMLILRKSPWEQGMLDKINP
eukprot:scaffold160660_cov13-Prasinocladus_malaysianus.AAC.1